MVKISRKSVLGRPAIGVVWMFRLLILKSASNLNDNLNCSKELEHYAS